MTLKAWRKCLFGLNSKESNVTSLWEPTGKKKMDNVRIQTAIMTSQCVFSTLKLFLSVRGAVVRHENIIM